jgi:UDP-4-amino-4,6-dideoxy-N-acetyl-beta-L-altrosamine transaminase
MLPYGKQTIDEDDRRAVENVLRGNWLTTGPAVSSFEAVLCQTTGARQAVAMSSGTAALHAATTAIDIQPDDEVIVPAISFVASANCILYRHGRPVFADICKDTMNIDPADVARKITKRTKAIVAVDFAGHPCDHDELRGIAAAHNLRVISDAAHSLGATYRGRSVGTLQGVTTLSFHPVKIITTGEGGALLTDNDGLAKRARSFRHHGIDIDLHARAQRDTFEYDVTSLGFNYRITDICCALGCSQIGKLESWIARRRAIAAMYRKGLAHNTILELPTERSDCRSAWHLYVVRLNLDMLRASRREIFAAMRAENIGVNVHYIPIPWLTLYRDLGYQRGHWPVAEAEYERTLSIPIYPGMKDEDAVDVIAALEKVLRRFRR